MAEQTVNGKRYVEVAGGWWSPSEGRYYDQLPLQSFNDPFSDPSKIAFAGTGAGQADTFGLGKGGATAQRYLPAPVDATNTYENRLLALLDNPDSIANTGAYKFRVNQGQQALERSAAAKGMTGSGNVLAELLNYGQGQAAQSYDTEANRLGGLTGVQKNYILGLRQQANADAATQNQFSLGEMQNRNQFAVGMSGALNQAGNNQLDWFKVLGAPGSTMRRTGNWTNTNLGGWQGYAVPPSGTIGGSRSSTGMQPLYW